MTKTPRCIAIPKSGQTLIYALDSHSSHMKEFTRYFLTGTILWVVVDWTTAFNPDFERWISYMPEIWLFYVGYPLIFAFLIYRRKWSAWGIFLAMLAGAFIVEVVFTGNKMLYTFPIMLIGIPAAISIYGLLTFAPKWIVENRIRQNKRKLIPMIIVWILISISTLANGLG